MGAVPGNEPKAMDPAFRPEILDFSLGAFHLGRDLERLDLVGRVGAPEAVVLYGARIAEALAGSALLRLGLASSSSSTNLYGMLCALEGLGVLDGGYRYGVHGLRRLGNGVRHVWYAPAAGDAEAVEALLGAWLEWFFLRFLLGARLPALRADGTSWPPAGASLAATGLRAAFDVSVAEEAPRGAPRSEATDEAGRASWEALADRGGTGDLAIVGAAVETLIACGRHVAAGRLLARGRARSPDDLRLAQLQGLLLSREGDHHGALDLLEGLKRRNPGDGETLGILAGALKREAERSGNPRLLQRAHTTYRKAWQASRGQNEYVGINAAATALFLGRADKSREIASQVGQLLQDRSDAVARCGAAAADPQIAEPYYPTVTRAEACLLEGAVDEAARIYRRAFEAHAAREGDIEGTRTQADRILRALGREETLADLLDRV